MWKFHLPSPMGRRTFSLLYREGAWSSGGLVPHHGGLFHHCMYTYAYTQLHIHIHPLTHFHTHTHSHNNKHIYTLILTYTVTHTFTESHTFTHTLSHIHSHIHNSHTHTHSYISFVTFSQSMLHGHAPMVCLLASLQVLSHLVQLSLSREDLWLSLQACCIWMLQLHHLNVSLGLGLPDMWGALISIICATTTKVSCHLLPQCPQCQLILGGS